MGGPAEGNRKHFVDSLTKTLLGVADLDPEGEASFEAEDLSHRQDEVRGETPDEAGDRVAKSF